MCGIVFAIDCADDQVINAITLLKHRGPDANHFWRYKNVTLGHTLLSIMNGKGEGIQPYTDLNTLNTIAWNGEIYNINELTKKYFSNQTHLTDTAQLINLLTLKGENVLSELDGMFSLLFFNASQNTILIARDRQGIKPLYFSKNKKYFSSEIKVIQQLLQTPSTINSNAFQQYLNFGYSANYQTLWNEIDSFPKGHFQVFLIDNNSFSNPIPYAENVVDNNTNSSFDDARNELFGLLNESVNSQSLANAKVGLMLSGGLDSSILLSAMKNVKNTTSFVVNQEGLGSKFENDFNYALSVSKHFGSKLIEVDAAISVELPKKLAQILEEPVCDIAAWYQYKIAEKAHSNGIKVLISGTGADELFAGYRRHAAWYKSQRNIYKILGLGLNPFKNILSNDFKKWLDYQNSNDVLSLFRIDSKNIFNLKQDKLSFFTLQNVLQFEQDNYLLYNNLLVNDKASMATSVEMRVPFLSNKIVALAKNLPEGYLYKNGIQKYILKEAFKNQLPSSILNRKKTGMAGIPSGVLIHEWENQLLDSISDINYYLGIDDKLLQKLLLSKSINYKQIIVLLMTLYLIKNQ